VPRYKKGGKDREGTLASGRKKKMFSRNVEKKEGNVQPLAGLKERSKVKPLYRYSSCQRGKSKDKMPTTGDGHNVNMWERKKGESQR